MRDLRVLVVDDDPPCRDALVEFLHREGFAVSVACDGSEALHMILQQNIDCSVMDVNMPGLTGPEVIYRIVAAGHPQVVPPTVFVSSDQSAAQQIEHTLTQLTAAPLGFLPKPVRLDALRRTLELMLQRGSDSDSSKSLY